MVMPPIDFNALDTAVHGPIRLGVLAALRIDGPLDFTTLKNRLETTDGALGQHLRTLEEIGYVACRKSFVGRRPKSTYRLTRKGVTALRNYTNAMRALLDAVEAVEKKRKAKHFGLPERDATIA